jgi:hypothetical protein
MFQTEIEEGSFVSFLFQQAAACVVSVVWALLVSVGLARLNEVGLIGKISEGVGNMAAALGPSFFIGRLVQTKSPRFAYSGRWIWLLPTSLFTAWLLAVGLHPTGWQYLATVFFPPNDAEEMWGVVFFTYPTFGCLGYSLGIWSRRRSSGL